MKFSMRSAHNGCRLGVLTLGNGHSTPPRSLQTPLCLVYTRCGSVPHLSKDVLQKVEAVQSSCILQMPLTLLMEHHEAIAGFGKGIKKFTANQDLLVHSCIQDPAEVVPSGYNDKLGCSVWGRGGRIKIDVGQFMAVQEALQADCYQALCDSDTDKETSEKRLRKSVERTLALLDACLEKHSDSEKLKGTGVIGVIEGGYKLHHRLKSASETAKRSVDGFCIEGFHHFGPESENFKLVDVSDLLQKTMAELPKDKPRMLPGILTPHNVLEAVKLGFDIIDTSYVYIVTERGGALVLDYTVTASGNQPEPTAASNREMVWEIDLKNKRYKDDFGSLLLGCTCYTCTTHTRSYIHHLLNTSELLAGTLLMIHNLHHFLGFLAAVRTSIQEDTFEQLCDLVNLQESHK